MAFDIGIGDGKTATVTEPARAQFTQTFGGAVEFAFCHLLYKFLEVCGGGLGAFIAGFGVQLMERIEPALVTYTKPLIDWILGVPDLDPHLKEFFTQLRTPTHEAAAAILGGLATQAGGAVVGNLLGVMLAVPTKALNRLLMPAIPDIQTVLTMWHKGSMGETQARFTLKEHGLTDGFIDQLHEVSRSRAGAGDLIQAHLRGTIDYATFVSKMKGFGFSDADIPLLQQNAQQLMTFGDMLQAVYRKQLTYDQLRGVAKKAGMTDVDITTLINSSKPIPGANDLVRMAVREAFTDSIATKYGYDADYPAAFPTNMALWGFSPEWSKYYWRAKWELPSPGMGYDMLHRGIIDATTLDELLRVLDYPNYWREKLVKLSFNPLTRVDVRRMFKMGVVSRAQVKKTYTDLGYDAANAELLTRFTEVTYAPDPEDPLKDKKDLTTTLITAGYKKGIVTRAQATVMLAAIHYIPVDIEFILAQAETEDIVATRKDYMAESKSDLIGITETAYVDRTLKAETARTLLAGQGMTEAEITVRMGILDLHSLLASHKREIAIIGSAYISRALTQVQTVAKLGQISVGGAEQTKLFAEWDITRSTGDRRMTVKEYSDAYYMELITLEEATDALRGLGYAEKDIPVLLKLKIL